MSEIAQMCHVDVSWSAFCTYCTLLWPRCSELRYFMSKQAFLFLMLVYVFAPTHVMRWERTGEYLWIPYNLRTFKMLRFTKLLNTEVPSASGNRKTGWICSCGSHRQIIRVGYNATCRTIRAENMTCKLRIMLFISNFIITLRRQ
jgi:hypothetical protein